MSYDKSTREKITSIFRFVISVDDNPVAAFTECTMPSLELETVNVKEGGLNTYIHQLPGPQKPARLTMKNGVGLSSELQTWYLNTLGGQFTRKRISVSLLNSQLSTVMTMDIENAYPVKWSGPQLKTDDSTIAIETLEFVCGEISISSG